MTTFYVDYQNGSDANNGLGPDASHATNKPWKTVTKLLGAAGMASGDTGYLAPVVFRETVALAMTSAVAETKIIGDPANTRGFKTAGGVLLPAGEVKITAYTTNDKTAPAATPVLQLLTRDYLHFQRITFQAGSGNPGLFNTGNDATNITFTECFFLGYFFNTNSSISITNTSISVLNLLFDRCRFFMRTGISLTATKHASADYDVGVEFRNCTIFSQAICVDMNATGANAFLPGGLLFLGSTVWSGSTPAIRVGNTTACSTTIPCLVKSCICVGSTNALIAGTSGQIVEEYCHLIASTPRVNVSVGTGSVSDGSYAVTPSVGQEPMFGAAPRPWLMPAKDSPWLGFSSGTMPAVDQFNRPRPAGGASALKAVGSMERGNTWARETGTVRTGANALSITGPGYHDFDVAVDAASTDIKVWMRYDGTYSGTKPTISVVDGEECGVAAATSSAVTTVDTWEQLTLTIVPTSAGIVTLRLNSTDTNGGGKAFADDVTVV